MRKPLFVGLATGAALLIGGGVAAAMADRPVDAAGRAAIAQPSASPPASSSASPSATPSDRTTISRDEAKAIALRYVGGGVIESAELEWEHGRLIWDVDVIRNGAEWDVEIDAKSGAVLETEAEARHDDNRHDGRDDHGDDRRDDRSGPGGGDDHHGDDDNSGPGGGDD